MARKPGHAIDHSRRLLKSLNVELHCCIGCLRPPLIEGSVVLRFKATAERKQGQSSGFFVVIGLSAIVRTGSYRLRKMQRRHAALERGDLAVA